MNVARTEVGCCPPSGVEQCRNVERRRLVINQIRQVEDARLEHLKQAPKTVVSRREQIVALATREKISRSLICATTQTLEDCSAIVQISPRCIASGGTADQI
jgi:hypothetical protein